MKTYLMEALEILVDAQRTCSAITLKLGTTCEGRVINDKLYILDCPPIVIDKLYKAGFTLSLSDGELSVIKY